jgi:hypothetical protein
MFKPKIAPVLEMSGNLTALSLVFGEINPLSPTQLGD